jgi:hypothetical protein
MSSETKPLVATSNLNDVDQENFRRLKAYQPYVVLVVRFSVFLPHVFPLLVAL